MRNMFLCWSGDRSQLLASGLHEFLPKFIPGLVNDPAEASLFMSHDIAKGTRWFDEVEKELDKADVGLVCITREGLQSGWIHFEAGALARAVRKNRRTQGGTLYTYLLGVRSDELKGPLAEFQATTFDRDDTKKLCAAIVSSMGQEAPLREVWETAFNENWPAFAEKIEAIGPQPAAALIPELEDLFRRKTFNEPLEECTRQSWIDRFTAARETIAALEAHRPIMKADNTYLLDLYNDLLAELDGYSMNMGALLLTETRFDIDKEMGKLVVGNGIRRACESRRGRIRQLVTHLLAPDCAPVLESEARRYAKMSSFDARKTIVIHPAEREIEGAYRRNQPRLSERELNRCAASLWEFDRIYFYLVQERTESASIDRLIGGVEQEFEKVRAVEGGGSLVPLHYAMRALKIRLRAKDPSERVVAAPDLDGLLGRIEQVIKDFGLDPGRQVRHNIDELRTLLVRVPTTTVVS
jgi:hypothetical protein